MIALDAIVQRLDQELNTGLSDARHHITSTLRLTGHQGLPTMVDDLEAHEIYEATLSRYGHLADLAVEGQCQIGDAKVTVMEPSFRLQLPKR